MLSTPSLWTHIVIERKWSNALKMHTWRRTAALSLLQAHLKRSGNMSFDLICLFHDLDRDIEAQIWSLITPHLHRCRRLEIHPARASVADSIIPWDQTVQLKRLECIDVTVPSVVPPELALPLFEDTKLVPKLTEMRVTSVILRPST